MGGIFCATTVFVFATRYSAVAHRPLRKGFQIAMEDKAEKR
jgi:hypothetical protein